MTLNTILVVVLGLICYFILPFLIWSLVKKQTVRNILTIVFFGLYLVVLFCGVFGQIGVSSKDITLNFEFNKKWCSKNIIWSLSFTKLTKFDLIINLVMLMPVGMFAIYFLSKKKLWQSLLIVLFIGLSSGIFIETMQFILPIQRSVQLTDILLNTISVIIGGIIGWGYILATKKLRKEK